MGRDMKEIYGRGRKQAKYIVNKKMKYYSLSSTNNQFFHECEVTKSQWLIDSGNRYFHEISEYNW